MIKYLFLVFLLVGAVLAYLGYTNIWATNVPLKLKSPWVYISEGDDLQTISAQLYKLKTIENPQSFTRVARLMKYEGSNIKSGRYKIQPGINNRQLITHLRSGNQDPVKLTFNNLRSIEDLAGRISSQLQMDSITLLKSLLSDSTQLNYGFTKDNFMCMFIPNSYQIYWDSSVESFLDKMNTEHSRFWNETRVNKAKAINLSPNEVYILASIVEKETLVKSEKSTIAGVYLNRLKKSMLLQADPTVVFAVNDFSIRRVLNKHLAFDSPYNTYKYPGLPPGPIYMPDISTIDATLSPETHDYIYFCAKADNSGRHAFAKNSAQHARNARAYQAYLTKSGIMK